MKHYFLGAAANYSRKERLTHTFTIGRKKNCDELEKFLVQKYSGEQVFLTKNGRSALALALKAYFKPGDAIIVNGFTCYAVYEAIKSAGLTPVWTDISRDDLNFNAKTIEDAEAVYSGHAHGRSPKLTVPSRPLSASYGQIRGIVIQNSLGNPVDIEAIEKLAKKHGLLIIEDLAHCVGVQYPDGREVGTVGIATALSFGKDKSIDTISGGALILRQLPNNIIKAPSKSPKISDTLRARFYPLFGAISRGLSYVHLGGVFMKMLVKIHFVEKSADSKLDLNRKIAKFEAKLALEQLKNTKKLKRPLREFYLVKNRAELLKKLKANGYYFEGFWYEKPVSPERYYKKVHFPENECPVAVKVTKEIINFPSYYNKKELDLAHKIITDYIEEDKK